MHLPQNLDKGVKNDSEKYHLGGSNFTVSGIPVEPDFSEFMWMADEDLEEFDRQVINEIDEHFGLESEKIHNEEEESFLQKMLEEEEERDTVYFHSDPQNHCGPVNDLNNKMHHMNVSGNIASQSNLNPNAAEFVPRQEFQNPKDSEMHGLDQREVSLSPDPNSPYSRVPAGNGNPEHNPNLMTVSPPIPTDPITQSIILGHRHTDPRNLIQPHRYSDQLSSYYPNATAPVYLSNVPVYQFMNGSPYIHSSHSPYLHLENVRSNDDEGYGDY